MAFKVEDGTGVVGATSYATVAGFKAYYADRAVEVSAISDPTIQGLLVRASDYINTRWGRRFKGTREYNGLLARSVLTLTDVPTADDTVTVGDIVYTFKAVPSEIIDTEVEIGASELSSLVNLSAALGSSDNEAFVDVFFADPDIAAMTIMVADDGVVTTETLADGSFDAAISYGSSNRIQPLEFPRSELYDSEGYQVFGMPDKLKYATYEYALRANTAALSPDPVVSESGGKLTKVVEKVGPIVTEAGYSSASAQITKPYPAADRLLSDYVQHSVGVIRN